MVGIVPGADAQRKDGRAGGTDKCLLEANPDFGRVGLAECSRRILEGRQACARILIGDLTVFDVLNVGRGVKSVCKAIDESEAVCVRRLEVRCEGLRDVFSRWITYGSHRGEMKVG